MEERWAERFRLLWFAITVVIVLFGIMWLSVKIGEYLTDDLDTRVMKNYIYAYEMCD